jgi:hypothetical protein
MPATLPPPAECIPTKKSQVSKEVSSLSVSATHQAAPDLKNLQLPDARSLTVAQVKMLKMPNTGRPSGWPFKGRLKLPAPVQDLSLAQVVNKLGMARVRLTHAKEVMVVDSSKATKIKVGLKQNISDS